MRKQYPDAKLDMTPMIDVVFQLLIYFIVTTKPIDVITNLDVFRPAPDKNAPPDQKPPNLVRIGVFQDGYTVNDVSATPELLDTALAKVASIDAGRTYMMHVPGAISAGLSDAQIAEVTNYILEEWSDGAAFTPFDAAEVTRRRAVPVSNVVEYRRVVADDLAAQGIELAEYPWP